MNTNHMLKKEQELLKQLMGFGLNPEDWSIRPASLQRYLIEHKTDRDFQFMGEIHSNTANETRWERIRLVNI